MNLVFVFNLNSLTFCLACYFLPKFIGFLHEHIEDKFLFLVISNLAFLVQVDEEVASVLSHSFVCALYSNLPES